MRLKFNKTFLHFHFFTFSLFHFVMLVVLTTTPNTEEAESLARKIVEARLAGCVQILPPMKSFYFWENEIQTDTEHLLLIKTLEENFDDLEEFIQKNHSYDTPEIVALAAEKVSKSYLGWMENYLITDS
jgi:periplasmic divalent cation tolerance protein